MDKALYTFSEAARRLGVRRETVSDLVKRLNVLAIRHPVNHKAKAIDAEGLARITEAMTPALASQAS